MRALMWFVAMLVLDLVNVATTRLARLHRAVDARREDCEINWLLARAEAKLAKRRREQRP